MSLTRKTITTPISKSHWKCNCSRWYCKSPLVPRSSMWSSTISKFTCSFWSTLMSWSTRAETSLRLWERLCSSSKLGWRHPTEIRSKTRITSAQPRIRRNMFHSWRTESLTTNSRLAARKMPKSHWTIHSRNKCHWKLRIPSVHRKQSTGIRSLISQNWTPMNQAGLNQCTVSRLTSGMMREIPYFINFYMAMFSISFCWG